MPVKMKRRTINLLDALSSIIPEAEIDKIRYLKDLDDWRYTRNKKSGSVTVTVPIKNVICYGIPLGDFRVRITADRTSLREPKFSGEVRPGGVGVHPHLDWRSNNQFVFACWGSTNIANVMFSRDISRMIEMSHSLLESYNPASPYMSIGRCAGIIIVCDSCKNKSHLHAISQCCGDRLCDSCYQRARCIACSKIICKKCDKGNFIEYLHHMGHVSCLKNIGTPYANYSPWVEMVRLALAFTENLNVHV